MDILIINFKQIKVIPVDKENEKHRRGVWIVKNENLGYNLITTEPIPYEKHCIWWQNAFEKEHILIILYNSEVCGYIRLTKVRTGSKEKNEISIAISKKFQKTGIGSYAYKLFENKMKEIGVSEIIALNHISNEIGQRFFEKNKFDKTFIRYIKKL